MCFNDNPTDRKEIEQRREYVKKLYEKYYGNYIETDEFIKKKRRRRRKLPKNNDG